MTGVEGPTDLLLFDTPLTVRNQTQIVRKYFIWSTICLTKFYKAEYMTRIRLYLEIKNAHLCELSLSGVESFSGIVQFLYVLGIQFSSLAFAILMSSNKLSLGSSIET